MKLGLSSLLLAAALPALHSAPETPAMALRPAAPLSAAATDTAAVLKAALQPLYPGLTLYQYKAGDLNADGRADLVVVAEKPCDSASGMEDAQCRTTLLVLNEGWPKLRIVAVNNDVVGCSTCGGGGVGDAFQRIVIRGGYFSIENLFGDCAKTHFVVTFRYDAARHDWFLHRFGRVDYSCQNTKKGRETRVDAEDYGVVSFAKFSTGY